MVIQPLYFWKKAPVFRLLLPFIAGILLQWYGQLSPAIPLLLILCSAITLSLFFLLPFFYRYKLFFANGIVTSVLFVSLGALLTYKNDIRHNRYWFGRSYHDSTLLLVTIDEPPIEKAKSVKAEAIASRVFNLINTNRVTGKVILYFQKDTLWHQLGYGSQIIFKKSLQEIRNTSNPGGFDFKQYSLFHGITHQVYMQPADYVLLPGKNENNRDRFIYYLQEKILTTLRKYIKPEKERGLAEALLIGYKDDLDKTLVQSYSHTGVVHIIAISGLHLGLIYWLLLKLFQPLQKRKKIKWLRPLLIISGLWVFTLLAGAQPSVLRSALMFTCIAAGESLTRKTSMYNTLSLSAFMLLCYDPYWLWDVGFQLSYAAVISIVLFSRPVYNLFYFKNKILDQLWKLNSITISAQLLTLPVSLYHFHQFPNYFLLTNLVAIPLSSIILMGEIMLCVLAFIPVLAIWLGKIITWLVWLMNTFIERTEALPFSLWNGLQVNLAQAILLTVFITTFSYWLMQRSGILLKLSLIALLGFTVLRSFSFITSARQQKIIVYNIPQKRAIDLINGFHASFTGDTLLQRDALTKNFYLTPSRTLYRVIDKKDMPGLTISGNYMNFLGTHILCLDRPVSFIPVNVKQNIDLLILSKNVRVSIKDLIASISIKQVVLDATMPAWQTTRFEKDCDSLHIPCYDVTVKGAFAMNLR